MTRGASAAAGQRSGEGRQIDACGIVSHHRGHDMLVERGLDAVSERQCGFAA